MHIEKLYEQVNSVLKMLDSKPIPISEIDKQASTHHQMKTLIESYYQKLCEMVPKYRNLNAAMVPDVVMKHLISESQKLKS